MPERKDQVDLKSSVASVGEKVTKIIHFSGGNKRTVEHVDTGTIKQGQFTKFKTDNCLVMINDANVDMIEVFEE